MVCVCIYIYGIGIHPYYFLLYLYSYYPVHLSVFELSMQGYMHAALAFDRSVYCRSATTSDVGASALADLLAYLRIHLAREARTCLRSQAALKCRLSCRQIESNHTDHLRSFKDLLIMNSSESGI